MHDFLEFDGMRPGACPNDLAPVAIGNGAREQAGSSERTRYFGKTAPARTKQQQQASNSSGGEARRWCPTVAHIAVAYTPALQAGNISRFVVPFQPIADLADAR